MLSVKIRPVKRLLVLCLALLPVATGCGGGDSGASEANAAVELTKLLPQGQVNYAAVDLDGLRQGYGLEPNANLYPPPKDADPLVSTAVSTGLLGVSAANPDADVYEALELGTASAIASSNDGVEGMTVIATDADPSTVESNLGELGYEKSEGVLAKGDRGLGFIVEDGLIFAAASAGDLRDLPKPGTEAPEPLLERGDGVFVYATHSAPDCVEATAQSLDTDGTGEVSFRVDGEPDPAKLNFEDTDSVTFDEPEVDGDVISVRAAGRLDATAISEVMAENFFTYEC